MQGSDHSFVQGERGDSGESPPTIPGHELLRPIAHGSYGEIWLARTELGAFRAVKIIRRATFSNAKPFDREFAGIQRYEPISREHEGLVDVLQVGRDEAAGFFYYVMELADGANRESEKVGRCENGNLPPAHSPTFSPAGYSPLTLAYAIHSRTRLPVDEVVTLGIRLARALEFLHSRRLVHRDIKPSNIIFVGGQPKLADVGLIADLGGPLTFVGTEGYIPPEGPGGVQADIYSLGKVLYEAASGNDRQEFPDLAIQLGEVPDKALLELNEVLLKACESNPRARYSSAAAMATDLERIKAGQSLRTRRARQRRLHAIAAATALFGGLALVSVGLVAFVQYERSKPRLLFLEDFDGSRPDTNLWTWNQKNWGPYSSEAPRQPSVNQSGGEIVLNAKVGPSNDTAVRAVWLDFVPDLRTNGPCRIELDLAGSVQTGALGLTICEGYGFTNSTGFEDKPLARFPSLGNTGPQEWLPRALRIDLLPHCQAAIVFANTNQLEEFEIWDLASLPAWHLRFWARATTSIGFETGMAELRVQRVRITGQSDDQPIVGHIIEEVSEWPVEGAVLKDPFGKLLAKTRTSGAFVLRRPSRGALVVEKTDYLSTNIPVKPYDQPSSVLNVRLVKTNFVVGDMVGVIPCDNHHINAIGFWNGSLWAFIGDPDRSGRFLKADTSKMRLDNATAPIPTQTWLTSFAECNGRLIGLGSWHGKDYNGVVLDFSAEPPRELLVLTDPGGGDVIRWPRGCAFDGQYFWFAETDFPANRYQLHRLDLARWKLMDPLQTGGRRIFGLAWDGKQLWASTDEGKVYPIDPDGALRLGNVSYGVGRSFSGNYECLAFGQGYLWGLEQARRRICKIKVSN